ncbi:hypothetical protein NDU88_004619 [Pleurodeles waltl]|uniref:C3H1-type domain-containing protein n=1 Tax=Pleurodeles waltl TaxID=8319 RepID=A0AAV7L0E8_PLEWA|nr:hypothetical protein NDU88_004619 [Pleurodeles waltl]
MIVQECLKSMAPLLFANPGGAHKPKGSGGTDSNGHTASSDARRKVSQVNRAEALRTRCPSPERGDDDAASTSVTASPTQVWGTDADKNALRRHSPADCGLALEAYKRGSLGRPYMVTTAPGLASMIPLGGKERIWRREFIEIFTQLEIQVEGLDLTTVDRKEEERRERNRVRKERNFDNWLDAFRIMACIIVQKYPHCAKDLWLYESKIHETQREFTGDAWLDYEKGFRLKMQAHLDIEWDEEDVTGYMQKIMIAREAKSWENKGEQPFRGGFRKGRHEKANPFYKRQQYTQWKGPQTGKATTAICYKFDKDECTWGSACKFRHACSTCGRGVIPQRNAEGEGVATSREKKTKKRRSRHTNMVGWMGRD